MVPSMEHSMVALMAMMMADLKVTLRELMKVVTMDMYWDALMVGTKAQCLVGQKEHLLDSFEAERKGMRLVEKLENM